MRAFCELNHQAVLRLRSSPRLAVDKHRSVAWLHAQHERSEASALRSVPGDRRRRRHSGHRREGAWHRLWFRRFSWGERIQSLADRVRRSRVVVDVLPQRAMAGMIDDDFVRPGHEPQPLKDAVVVVHNPRGVPVDKHGRFARRHQQTHGDSRVVRVDARRIRVRIWIPLTEAEIIGIVEAAVEAENPPPHRSGECGMTVTCPPPP